MNRPDFLMELFRTFYLEVVDLKRDLMDQPGAEISELSPTEEPESEAQLLPAVHRRLVTLLRQQAQDVERTRTVSEIEAYQEAQYVMAAMTDEILLLELEWPGNDGWENYLLEMALFRTQSSGTVFFEKLDHLLENRDGDELAASLAGVFLFAMRLGFQGQYRGDAGKPVLRNYRQKIYQLLGNRRHDQQVPLFEEAYRAVVNPSIAERLAPLGKWWKLSFWLIVGYVASASLMWQWLVQDLWTFVRQ